VGSRGGWWIVGAWWVWMGGGGNDVEVDIYLG